MMPLFLLALVLIATLVFLLLRQTGLNIGSTGSLGNKPAGSPERYRPMLRLLSEEPLNPAGRQAFRARRRAIFRGYLRCMRRDYARVVAGLHQVMVESPIDRPDLDAVIRQSRRTYALAMIRIELGLWQHALGLGTVDLEHLSRLLDQFRTLTSPATSFAAA